MSKSKFFLKDRDLMKSAIEKIVYGYSQIRSGHFALQGAALPWVDKLSGQAQEKQGSEYINHLKKVLPKIQKLFLQDSKNIANGVYPISVLAPENPVKHFSRIPFLYIDAFRASLSKQNKQTKNFDEDAQELLAELPDYYKRNFHFQGSGYLGKKSAELYEHQVEVLFSGSADAMRRSIIPPIKTHFLNSDGQGLRFLEIGSGTGRLTKFMTMAFPKATITCVDLSPYYLNLAAQLLRSSKRLNYVQGAAEKLNFKDASFDAVFSCYLFHELPEDIRQQVLKEGFRLLKAGGIYALADSLQKNDDKDLDWALQQFPKNFHEPFYKNYTLVPMEHLLKQTGFTNVFSHQSFLTKVVVAKRP